MFVLQRWCEAGGGSRSRRSFTTLSRLCIHGASERRSFTNIWPNTWRAWLRCAPNPSAVSVCVRWFAVTLHGSLLIVSSLNRLSSGSPPRPSVRAEGGGEGRAAGGSAAALAGAGEGDGGRHQHPAVGGGPGAEGRRRRPPS